MHGTVHGRYQSKGVCIDLVEQYERVKAGVKKDHELREFIRKRMVNAMRVGKPLIINCDVNQLPNFYKEFDHFEKGLTWHQILNWHSFRTVDNYMKLVPDNENFNQFCDKGKFKLHENFNIYYLVRCTTEKQFWTVVDSIPNNNHLIKAAILQ